MLPFCAKIYDQQYFTKLFCKASGGVSPMEWIQQYVVTQAKLLIDANPKQTIKETAYQLTLQPSNPLTL